MLSPGPFITDTCWKDRKKATHWSMDLSWLAQICSNSLNKTELVDPKLPTIVHNRSNGTCSGSSCLLKAPGYLGSGLGTREEVARSKNLPLLHTKLDRTALNARSHGELASTSSKTVDICAFSPVRSCGQQAHNRSGVRASTCEDWPLLPPRQTWYQVAFASHELVYVEHTLLY